MNRPSLMLAGQAATDATKSPLAGMTRGRSHGLDTLRAIAITLVFMYHYMVFVSREPTFGWASTVGWVGVDLFFVLSGYLIGHQIFEGLARGQQLSLPAFYARRALRTWPAFWVVLPAYFAFPAALGGRTPPPLWKFLTFVQNIGLQPGTAFSHAWSLCIEEQFYLLLPLVVLGARALGSGRARAWCLLGSLMAIATMWRAMNWLPYGREATGHIDGYYPNIYYASLCRFDEFLPGIAVALVRNFHPALWARLMSRGMALFLCGLAASAAVLWGVLEFYYVDGYGYPFFMSVFGYPLIAMSFALLVASALSSRSPLNRVRIPGAEALAVLSYSIYLSHKAVAYVLAAYALQYAWSPSIKLLAIGAACVATAYLLHRAIEVPFMRLRSRHVPQLFHTGVTQMPTPNST